MTQDKGVAWNKAQSKLFVYVNVNGKRKHLGTYIDKDDAIKARLDYNKEI